MQAIFPLLRMRMSIKTSRMLAAIAFASLAATLAAQTVAVSATPDGRSIFMPLVPDAPFRAKVTGDFVKLLPDGTKLSQKYYAFAARDASGRLYREERQLVAADSDREPALMRTMVYDPKTSLITLCNPARSTCRLENFNPASHPVEEPVGLSPDGTSTLTRESLGWKKIGDLDVQGTRETRLFRAGSLGNDRPIVQTLEYWYSPRLQMDLELTRDDPRSGTQHIAVTEIKLGEPGPEWFAVPAGYRLLEERTATQATMAGHSRVGPHSLEPLLEKDLSGMTPDQLTAAVKPVDAAVDAYAAAHAKAWPNDKNEYTADEMRQQLAMDLRMEQRNRLPTRDNFENVDLRMNQAVRAALDSPCLTKTIPGDPPNVPTNADALKAEQTAWLAVRDAWTAFLKTLFPDSPDAGFAMFMTSQRQSEFRKLQSIERNRGCLTAE